MRALTHLSQRLATFRHVLSRHTPWVLFCVVMPGFLGTPHKEGLPSLCRCWLMDEADSHRWLHCFHASAWCRDALVAHWSPLVRSQQVAVTVHGRAGRLGDHTAVGKDARRMPGGVTVPHDSDTQSTPHDYRDHDWGSWADVSARSPQPCVCLLRPAGLRAVPTSTRRSRAPPTARLKAACASTLFFRKWESELRVATSLVLEQIGHPQAVNALAPFANDPDPQVQKIAPNATETCS